MSDYRGAKAALALGPYADGEGREGERAKAGHLRLVFGAVLALGVLDLAVLNLHLAPKLAAQNAAPAAEAEEAPRPSEPARTAAPVIAMTASPAVVNTAPAIVNTAAPAIAAPSVDVPAVTRAPAPVAAEPKVTEPAPSALGRAMPDIEFDLNRVDTRNIESIRGLKAVLAALVADPSRRLLIRGHSDRLGGPAQHERLSRRRAESMKQWLVVRGAPADRIDVEAVGNSEPADPGDGPAAWAKNRRAELLWR